MQNRGEHKEFKPSEKWTGLFSAYLHRRSVASVLSPEQMGSRVSELLLRRIGTILRRLKADERLNIRITENGEFIEDISSVIYAQIPAPSGDPGDLAERKMLLALLASEFLVWAGTAKDSYEYRFLTVDLAGNAHIFADRL